MIVLVKVFKVCGDKYVDLVILEDEIRTLLIPNQT